MKIVHLYTPATRTTTLNEIPVGQVFSGSFYGATSGRRYSGIFLKVLGPSSLTYNGKRLDVFVTQLDGPGYEVSSPGAVYSPGRMPYFVDCVPVENYLPLDVELHVKGVAK